MKPGEGVRYGFGPLTLFVLSLPREWQLGYQPTGGDGDETEGWSAEPITESSANLPSLERFVAGGDSSSLTLLPRVADRSLVARPRTPLHMLPGEQTSIYVSAPVWIDVRVGEPGRSLREVPVRRLSDTWFGSSTLEGDVAYALKTHARARLEEMPQRTYRAITPVVVRNESSEVLPLDRINLPVPYLSIWATPEGFLWTEKVTLVRGESNVMAGLDVGDGAPQEAVGAELVSEPRRSAGSNLLVRAFSSLLSPFSGED